MTRAVSRKNRDGGSIKPPFSSGDITGAAKLDGPSRAPLSRKSTMRSPDEQETTLYTRLKNNRPFSRDSDRDASPLESYGSMSDLEKAMPKARKFKSEREWRTHLLMSTKKREVRAPSPIGSTGSKTGKPAMADENVIQYSRDFEVEGIDESDDLDDGPSEVQGVKPVVQKYFDRPIKHTVMAKRPGGISNWDYDEDEEDDEEDDTDSEE